MKILLLNPPQIHTKYQITGGVFPPLGISYIAANLIKHGHEVKILDALGEDYTNYSLYNKEDIYVRGMSIDRILSEIKQYNPDYIGISNMYSFAFPLVTEIISKIKLISISPIFIGGAHPSISPKECLEETEADCVIVGEGENTFLDLVEMKKKINDIDGIAYRYYRNEIIINPKTEFIENLDSLPFPAMELLPMENYFKAKEAHGSVKKDRWIPIITSRGCPFNCSFCGTVSIWHRKWRARSPKNVVDEIEKYIKLWNVTEIHFNDENMSMDITRLQNICKEIINRNLHISWQVPNGIRVEKLDFSTLKLMKLSGLYHLTLAPESASPNVLKLMNKNIDLVHVRQVVRWCKQLQIKTAAYFIFGFPGETRKDVDISLAYSRRLAIDGLDEVVYSLFTPLPGSKIAEKFTDLKYYDYLAIADLNRLPSWYKEDMVYLKNLRVKSYIIFHIVKFVFNPISFLKFVKNILSGVQETKTERTILKFLGKT
jgi:magnesium-protoporphyrin IX monomethyl ester (oxidative) cyclase